MADITNEMLAAFKNAMSAAPAWPSDLSDEEWRSILAAAIDARPPVEMPVAWRYKTDENPGKWHLSHMTPAEARQWNCITEQQPLYAAPTKILPNVATTPPAPPADMVHVLTVEREPDYWSRGHFYEGTRSFIDPAKVRRLPIGTKLFAAAPAQENRHE